MVPDFDLVVPGDGGTTGELLTFMEFNEEESVFHSREKEELDQNTSEETKLPRRHFLRTCEVCLEAEENKVHSYITEALHPRNDLASCGRSTAAVQEHRPLLKNLECPWKPLVSTMDGTSTYKNIEIFYFNAS